MEDNTVEEKQNYLREAILEKGYDTSLFTNFLEKKNPEAGVDINKWTIDDLKVAVDEFCKENEPDEDLINNKDLEDEDEVNSNPDDDQKESSSKPQEASANTNNEASEPQTEQTEEDPTQKEQKIKIDEVLDEASTNPSELSEDLENTYIKCRKIGETELSKAQNVNVTVSFPEIVEEGFFSKKYVTYLVTTSPFDYKVRRRYSDFMWLRNFFKTHFIFSAIPPIPNKNYSDRFSDFLITKRSRALQRFINGIIINPLLRNSNALYCFLTIENEDEWNKKKSEYNKLKQQTINLNSINTLTGKLEYKINPDKEMQFNHIKETINNNETLLKRLLESYKEILMSLVSVSEKMKENADIWNQLHINSSNLNEHQKVKQVYGSMDKLMDDWSNSIKTQVNLINLNLREFFRYIKNEFKAMKEVANQCDIYKTSFYKAAEKLLYKKEELYKRQDLLKWELDQNELINKLKLIQDKNYAFSKMLPRETLTVNNLKITYGAYLNSLIQEYQRIRELNGKRYPKQICTFSKSNASVITDFHVAHVDVLAIYS